MAPTPYSIHAQSYFSINSYDNYKNKKLVSRYLDPLATVVCLSGAELQGGVVPVVNREPDQKHNILTFIGLRPVLSPPNSKYFSKQSFACSSCSDF